MSTQMQASQPSNITLRNMLSRVDVREQAEHALGGWMNADTFLAQLIISFNDEKVSHCTEQSKFAAAHKCLAMALLPSMGHVAIIPRKFKDDNNNWGAEATIMVQWQGMQALMLRHPDVLDVQAHLVHATDVIQYDTVHKLVTDHKFDPFDPKRKFEKLEDVRGGYVVIQYRDGRPERHHFVDQEAIKKARSCAQTQDIWTKWFREQCIKTLFRNAYARRVVPIDPMVAGRVEEAIHHEDTMLGNDPERVKVIQPMEAPRISRSEAIAQQALQQSPLDVQQPRRQEEPAEDVKQEKTKRKTKAKEEKPAGPSTGTKASPPNVGNHLKDFASAIHAAKSSEAIEAAFEKYVSPSLSDQDYEECCALRDWKYEVTGLERPNNEPDDEDDDGDAEEGFMR